MSERRAATIVSMFWSRVAASGSRAAVWNKRGGTFQSRTWSELADDVSRYAHVLRSCGVEEKQPVVQIAENRYEWIVFDLAVQSLRAIHVPLHPTLSGAQMAEQIRHCGGRVVCFSGEEIGSKLAQAELPRGIRWLTYDATMRVLHEDAIEGIEGLAHGAPAEPPAERLDARPEDIATILYTSGTTGEPKGVMLSQANLASNTLGVLETLAHSPDDVRLAFLPLSHIFARTCDVYTWLAAGSQLVQAESRTTVLDDCRAMHPNILNAVPYFYERVVHVLHQQQDTSAEALRALLGGRIEHCCSGGAALAPQLYDFFAERGLPILQGYGLTESSPVITASSPRHNRRGAVGRPIPGVEVRIAADGEILTRGPHVMLGYYREPAATSAVIRDDWLYTGDLGQLDEDGYLFITGRKKEMIVTSAGKNVAPALLESLLSADPLIHQVMLVGDDRPCLGALIVPDPDHLRAAIIDRRIAVLSREAALAHPQVQQLYAEILQQRLASRAHYEQVPLLRLIPRAFSADLGEVTPKLTLRREVIARNLAQDIETMYAEGAARRAAECQPNHETKVRA